MFFPEEVIRTLEAISYLVTIIGLPIGLFVFVYEKRRERKDRERQAYQSANDKYIDLLNLCLTNPDLDIFDIYRYENPLSTRLS